MDELACGEWDIEFVFEVGNPFCFGFAAAIGEEDEGDAFGLEVAESFGGAGECGGGAEEDAVDADIGSVYDWLKSLYSCFLLKCKGKVRDAGFGDRR